jgi:hypothetical protein
MEDVAAAAADAVVIVVMLMMRAVLNRSTKTHNLKYLTKKKTRV